MITPPVLFVIFNRPDTTALVMEAIRAVRPERLYVAADGPRERNGDAARCEEARRIATEVDWPCELNTLFRNRNLGCGRAVSGALDWFFEHEEEGIILEDDCLPSHSFFRYCAELLERYRHDKRIMCISGNNFQTKNVTPYSYYFSRYSHCWGWATWRRAWALYDFDIARRIDFRQLGHLEAWSDGDPSFGRYWVDISEQMVRGEIDTWDYQWLFSCWTQHGLTCLPVRNLVTNIGVGPDATHTTDVNGRAACLPLKELDFPLGHPPLVVRHVEADRFTHLHHFGVRQNYDCRKSATFATIRQLIKRVPLAAILLAKI